MRHRKSRMKNEKAYLFVIPSVLVITSIFVGSGLLAKDAASDVISAALPVQSQQENTPNTGKKSDIKSIAQVVTPAKTTVDTLASYEPSGFDSPHINTTGTPNNALAWVCNYKMLPAPIIGTELVFPTDQMSAIIQVVGAGQGLKAVSSARSSVQACANRDGRGGIYVSTPLFQGTNGFTGYYQVGNKRVFSSVWQRGDVLFSVAGTSFDKVKALASEYDKEAQSILDGVCLHLDVKTSDSQRSPYYEPETYTGWNKGRKVKLSTKTNGLHPGILSGTQVITGNGQPLGQVRRNLEFGKNISVPSWTAVVLPTKPLPPFDGELPKPVPQPEAAPLPPVKRPTSSIIPERIKDLEGPGCGWAFTGQTAPLWDDVREKERADTEEAKAQKKLRADYKAYLAERAEYLDAWTEYYDSIMDYRAYAKEVKNVAKTWDELNANRAEYKVLLDEYWKSVERHDDFLKKQEAAQEEYNKAVLVCTVQQEEELRRTEEETPPATDEPPVTPPTATPPTATPPPTSPPPTPPASDDEPKKPKKPKLKCPPKRPAILDKEAPEILPIPETPAFPLPDAWKSLIPNESDKQ